MKTIMILLLFQIFTEMTKAQSGWFQLNSGSSSTLNSVYFSSPLTGWSARYALKFSLDL
ncbi:MAG: hypothetical protein ACRDFC_05955 [Ignavibacteria bacterium]